MGKRADLGVDMDYELRQMEVFAEMVEKGKFISWTHTDGC